MPLFIYGPSYGPFPPPLHPSFPPMQNELVVMCLCAQWCGVCRSYRAGFEALASQHGASFHWIDIEDEADWADWPDSLEVENFPCLMIRRGETVLFFGPMLPQPALLERMLESFGSLSIEEARQHANANDERRRWQAAAGFRRS